MNRVCTISFALFLLSATAAAQTPKRPITFDDLISMRRVSDLQISPDGKWIAYTVAFADKDANHTVSDIWIVATTGGEASRLTSLSGGADNELWSPDGKTIAFVSRVYPDCADDACNAKRDADKAKSKTHARIYTKLLYRH